MSLHQNIQNSLVQFYPNKKFPLTGFDSHNQHFFGCILPNSETIEKQQQHFISNTHRPSL